MRLYQVLSEAFLIEYDQAKTLQLLGAGIAAAARKDKSLLRYSKDGKLSGDDQEVAKWALGELERADSTPHKEYVQWLARTYAKAGGATQIEDIVSKGGDALDKYNEAKKKRRLPPTARDINTIKGLDALLSVVEAIPPEAQAATVNKGKSEVVYEDAQVRVIHLHDVAAAKYYGQGTRWCTAATNNNMYEQYAKSGKIYVILGKGEHKQVKLQFHFEDRQFMDPADEQVDRDQIWKQFPGMYQFFKNHGDTKDSTAVRGRVDHKANAKNLASVVESVLAPVRQGDLGIDSKQLYWSILSINVDDMNKIEEYETYPWAKWVKQALRERGTHLAGLLQNLGIFSQDVIEDYDRKMDQEGTSGIWIDRDRESPEDERNPEVAATVRKAYRAVSQYLRGGFGQELKGIMQKDRHDIPELDGEGGYHKFEMFSERIVDDLVGRVARAVHNSGKEYK